nr:tRNA pseudouridine(55) synthase TruB [Bacteroidota bacterium]
MIGKSSLTKSPDFINGEVILINKEIDWTSFDVVKSLRIFLKFEYGIKKIKIGHAGTLDPRATGLVIVCTGKKTKGIDQYQAQEKEYTGTFKLGETTPSYDSETPPDEIFPIDHITENLIHSTTKKFTGSIIQIPPVYSALKIDGKKAYEYARKNQEVKMRERQVEISSFSITKIDMPFVDFKVNCSKGTYIRSLAYDFGKALDSGAYLTSLCRTAIGEFRLEEALRVQEFKDAYCTA